MNSTKRVIVIEDDLDINKLISYNLSINGFSVESVYDGLVAQKRLEQEHFDIAVIDIMLPGIDGFDICKKLKDSEYSNKTFVIILTAKNDPKDRLYGHLLGAECYLTKPFSVTDLMGIINEFTALREKEFFVKSDNKEDKKCAHA